MWYSVKVIFCEFNNEVIDSGNVCNVINSFIFNKAKVFGIFGTV